MIRPVQMLAPALVAALVVGAGAAGAVAQTQLQTVGQPDPGVRATVDAFVAAITAGQADAYERMAQERYTPALLARTTPEVRRQMLERLRSDFGTMSVQGVRVTDGQVVIGIRGSTGAQGRFELALEPPPSNKISRVGVLLGDGGDRPGPPPAPIRGDMTPAELTAAVDAFVAPKVAADAFAGVVVIAKDGAPIVQRAYGLADREGGRAATLETRYNLGSINKLVTKTAIGQLVAAGKLALTDTIGTLLPDYPNPAAKPATVQQLLEHQGGVADFFGPAFDAADKTRFRSNADYYRFVAPMPLRHEPGARREYCNGCYIVLGAIVEKVSGMTYEDYVARHVYTPAGMTGAGPFPTTTPATPAAIGYTRRGGPGPDSGPLRPNGSLHGSSGSGAGGGYATAADLLAFDTALRTGKLLDPTRTAWMLNVPAVEGSRARAAIGAAGGAPGINAALESDGVWTVVVLANLDPPAATDLAQALRKGLGF
jgi:CubicO group peptidase (beta-lactamase class C family)